MRVGLVQSGHHQEEFEDTKGAIRILYRRRTDNTMAKRKSTKGQTTIYKTYNLSDDTIFQSLWFLSGFP
jgi:hypothetical protein